MSVFLGYVILLVCTNGIGVALLSWVQMNYLHLQPQSWLPGLPTTMGVAGLLVLVVCIILAVMLRPFSNIIRRLQSGGTVTEEETSYVLSFYRKMNAVSVAACVVGFVLGNAIIVSIKTARGVFPSDPTRMTLLMIQAVCYGAMTSVYGIFFLNEYFIRFRKLLKIHLLDESRRITKVSFRILMLIIVCVLFTVSNLMVVPYKLVFLYGDSSIGSPTKYYALNLIKMFLLSAVICAYPIYIVLGSLRKRFKDVSAQLKGLAEEGDLTRFIDITVIDDFGTLTSSINLLVQQLASMVRGIHSESDSVLKVAANLSGTTEESTSALAQLVEAFERIGEAERTQTDRVGEAGKGMKELAVSAEELEQNMEAQSAALQESSASIAQMTANINSVAEMSRRADTVSANLSKTSELGSSMIAEATDAINKIQEASEQVQNIIKVIQDISSQTNLLSMNAAIEAAHAGEAGKGFAVVANEVRSLAESSTKSSAEIQQHITNMVTRISGGVEAINKAGQAFQGIATSVEENQQIIQTISNAMEEQRVGAEETMKVSAMLSDALLTVNDLAKSQKEYAVSLGKTMDSVISTSDDVTQVIYEGASTMQTLSDSVDVVKEMVNENRSAAEKLERNIRVFRV